MLQNPELLKIHADYRMAELRQEAKEARMEQHMLKESWLWGWLMSVVPSGLERTEKPRPKDKPASGV